MAKLRPFVKSKAKVKKTKTIEIIKAPHFLPKKLKLV